MQTAADLRSSLRRRKYCLCCNLSMFLMCAAAAFTIYWAHMHARERYAYFKAKNIQLQHSGAELWKAACERKGNEYIDPMLNCAEAAKRKDINVHSESFDQTVDDLKMHLLTLPTFGMCDAHDETGRCSKAVREGLEFLRAFSGTIQIGFVSMAIIVVALCMFVVSPVLQMVYICQLRKKATRVADLEQQSLRKIHGSQISSALHTAIDNSGSLREGADEHLRRVLSDVLQQTNATSVDCANNAIPDSWPKHTRTTSARESSPFTLGNSAISDDGNKFAGFFSVPL